MSIPAPESVVGWVTSEQATAGVRPTTAPSASRVICSGRNCSPLIRTSASRWASVASASQPWSVPPPGSTGSSSGRSSVGVEVVTTRTTPSLRRAPTRVPSTSCWDTSRGDPGSLTSTTVVVVVGEPTGPGQIDMSSVAPDRPWPCWPCPGSSSHADDSSRTRSPSRSSSAPPGCAGPWSGTGSPPQPPPHPRAAAARAGTSSEPSSRGSSPVTSRTTSRSPTVVNRRPSDVFITSGSSTPASCRLVPVAPFPTAPSDACGAAASVTARSAPPAVSMAYPKPFRPYGPTRGRSASTYQVRRSSQPSKERSPSAAAGGAVGPNAPMATADVAAVRTATAATRTAPRRRPVPDRVLGEPAPGGVGGTGAGVTSMAAPRCSDRSRRSVRAGVTPPTPSWFPPCSPRVPAVFPLCRGSAPIGVCPGSRLWWNGCCTPGVELKETDSCWFDVPSWRWSRCSASPRSWWASGCARCGCRRTPPPPRPTCPTGRWP